MGASKTFLCLEVRSTVRDRCWVRWWQNCLQYVCTIYFSTADKECFSPLHRVGLFPGSGLKIRNLMGPWIVKQNSRVTCVPMSLLKDISTHLHPPPPTRGLLRCYLASWWCSLRLLAFSFFFFFFLNRGTHLLLLNEKLIGILLLFFKFNVFFLFTFDPLHPFPPPPTSGEQGGGQSILWIYKLVFCFCFVFRFCI